MGTINVGRLLLGALVAAVIYFVGDGIIHGALLGADYQAMMKRLNLPMEEDPGSYAFFALFDFGKALVAMVIYAAARARLGPGVRTAVFAGLVAWFACEVVPAIAAMPFPFFPKAFYLKAMAFTVFPMVVGAIAGGWLYREKTGA